MAYAPFNISTFVSNMTRDGARPNLFDISFPYLGDTFTLRAESSALPGSTVGVASAFFFGREAKFAGNRRFDDWSVQVLVDEKDYDSGGPRYVLENWMNLLNGHVNNTRDSGNVSPTEYQKDASVKHYSKDGSVIAQYKMIKCFPTSISPINLSWDANDQIERFSVTFAMQWWESTNGSTDVSGSATA
jgi:hypothetical protein